MVDDDKWLTMIGWSFYAHHVNGRATSVNGWSFYARHVSDFGFKGFLGVVLLASCSVYFGYKECVPVVGLHFPSECVPSLHWSPFAMYSVERFVLHGLRMQSIQSNDLSYMEQIPTSCILRAVYADLL